jgi:dipeptidyl aminopeptidase/acylaminoacyl peptidase
MWYRLDGKSVMVSELALRVVTFLFLPLQVLGGQGRPIRPEDVLGIREIDSDLRVSKDGKRIAFTLNEPVDPSKPGEQAQSNVWIVPTDRSVPPSRLAGSTGGEFSPRWSPDGRSLAFLSHRSSAREEVRSDQIYLVTHPDGSGARLTSEPGGVSQFAWSPNGEEIAYAAGAGISVVRVSTGQAIAVPRLKVDVREFAWSPDGRQLALTFSPAPESVSLSLVIVDRATGAIARTLSNNVADIPAALRWSPDGKWVTFVENSPSRMGSWLAMVPATGGRSHGILKDSLLTVWQVEWMPDSKRLMGEIVQGTQVQLATIDIETDAVASVVSLVQNQGGYGFSTNGSITAYPAQSAKSPNDVWVTTGRGTARRLTTLNPQTAAWLLGGVREISWRSTVDGRTIHGVLVTPPGFVNGRHYPMIVQGHPGDSPWVSGWLAKWWSWGQLLASRGYVVFLPNYRGVAGEGWRMHERLADWGGVAYQDLMDGVDEVVRQGIADSTRLGIGGWSNGGFMTEWAITHTTRFKVAVVKSGHANFFSLYGTSASNRPYLRVAFGGSAHDQRVAYEAHSPITFVRQCRTPTLLVYGSNDGVSPTQGDEFNVALKEQGVESELVIYQGEGHGLRSYEHKLDFQRRLVAWFDRYLN